MAESEEGQMIFRINGKRYKLRTDIWADRLGWLAESALIMAMLIMPIYLYIAPRW